MSKKHKDNSRPPKSFFLVLLIIVAFLAYGFFHAVQVSTPGR